MNAWGCVPILVQEKARLTNERENLRRFVSARLMEVEKMVRARKQQEDKRRQQDSQAASQQLKISAKALEAAARKQALHKGSEMQRQKQLEEARKLRQFIQAMGSKGETLDDLKHASERRVEKLRRAIERERQRQKEVLASKRSARAGRQAKDAKDRAEVKSYAFMTPETNRHVYRIFRIRDCCGCSLLLHRALPTLASIV